jgi:hypothetical protein
MGIHKRHVPGELAGKLKFERGPDGKIRPVDQPAAVHPETIAEERPPQAPDPRPNIPPHAVG